MELLTHIVNSDKVAADLKIEITIQDTKVPFDQYMFRSFLGLATYYRRVFKDIADIYHAFTFHVIDRKLLFTQFYLTIF